MPKIKLQNLNERYDDAGVKQKLIDLYTGQGFFVVGAHGSATPTRTKINSVIVSDKEINKISDLLNWNPDRPFFLSYLAKSASGEGNKIEKYLVVIGCKQERPNLWELHVKEVKENFDVFKLLKACKNGNPETTESI